MTTHHLFMRIFAFVTFGMTVAFQATALEITPVATLDASGLEPLVSRLTQAKIVGMGEPIHGTHLPHVVRAQIIRQLVSHHGFRLIAFESPFISAEKTNRYIQTCQGTSKEAISGLTFYAWYDEEIQNLLEWLCDYNREHPGDRVELIGFDVQGSRENIDYLARRLPDLIRDEWAKVGQELLSCPDEQDLKITAPTVERCKKVADALDAALAKLRQSPEVRKSRIALTSIKATWESVFSFMEAERQNDMEWMNRSYEARDSAIAEIFDTLRGGKSDSRKTVLYAHNWHIATNTDRHVYPVKARSFGTHLRRRFGSNYSTVGFISYLTEVNQELFPGWSAGATPPEALESRLHDQGYSYAFLDTRAGPIGKNPQLILDQAYPQGPIIASEHYDFLFFADYSPALKPPH